jgi:glycosyltransferase involved in cell wall biosynthesis
VSRVNRLSGDHSHQPPATSETSPLLTPKRDHGHDRGLSVVIPARNAAPTLGAQLHALLEQHLAAPLEIIVVDNGSRDGTTEVVRQFQHRSSTVALIDGSDLPLGGAAAKNAGVRIAKYPIIAFCDADDVVGPEWLSAMRSALEMHPVVTCDREYRSLNPHLHSIYESPNDLKGPYRIFGLPGISGGAFGIERDLYVRLGGFDESFPGAVDNEFAVRLARAGYVPFHEPRAFVSVRLTTSSWQAFLRARALSRSKVEIARRHGFPDCVSVPSLFRSFLRLLRPFRIWRHDSRIHRMTRAGTTLGRFDAWRADRRRLERRPS